MIVGRAATDFILSLLIVVFGGLLWNHTTA